MSLVSVAERLYTEAGQDMSADVREALSTKVDDLSESQRKILEAASETMLRGFFAAGVKGHEFVPASRIRERFGRSLAGNYPEAGPSFLRFASAYWTFKLALRDGRQTDTAAFAVLSQIEETVASIFFPTPGPVRIDPDQREETQRSLLAKYAPEIDTTEFLGQNPILIRDRAPAQTGCLLWPLVFATTAILSSVFA